ncbi:methyl viologen-reducing hydrogenase [candidate division TA06 bacterium SM23_40]|uniref:Methyl viologen-reducing hydrogenase n=1 Tax=candidate division TA06 bacterium SM23_40 TaxID=1703774 RepID=A0A0S8GEL7_UNCT6|nr:MAG: methyl viologen-reducing hydrogenase [candidate division TA06 bacterium SM23_40]
MPAKVAEEWLNICGGCEVTILDIGEPLLDLLPQLEFVHMPVLMDHKYYGQTGEKTELEIPEADVGIISGGVRNEKEKHVTEEMRKKCKTLVALGSCACFGGIPALANMWTLEELYDKVYRESKTTDAADTPSENIPPLLDRVYAIDEVVNVDAYIPGCPTAPVLIVNALTAILEGKPFDLPERSVCDECPTKREKKAAGGQIKRLLEDMQFDQDGPWENTRCFMEQGYLCLGPVTRAGCGQSMVGEGEEIVPRCVKGYMPCRGCFGPIRKGANPMVDMLGAISSIGLDPKQVEDRRALLNRYIGAQKRLRPLPKR